jgi:hypothetical protein
LVKFRRGLLFWFFPSPAESTALLFFVRFMGPVVPPCNYGLFHVIFLPRQQLPSWPRRQWQWGPWLSFYAFCFRMQDFLIVVGTFKKLIYPSWEVPDSQPWRIKAKFICG